MEEGKGRRRRRRGWKQEEGEQKRTPARQLPVDMPNARGRFWSPEYPIQKFCKATERNWQRMSTGQARPEVEAETGMKAGRERGSRGGWLELARSRWRRSLVRLFSFPFPTATSEAHQDMQGRVSTVRECAQPHEEWSRNNTRAYAKRLRASPLDSLQVAQV